jgi:hypothetical protein
MGLTSALYRFARLSADARALRTPASASWRTSRQLTAALQRLSDLRRRLLTSRSRQTTRRTRQRRTNGPHHLG